MVRPYPAFDLAPSERERDPMTLAAVGTLFPAIPLAIVALNFRYTSLAGLMRAISSQLDSSGIDGARRTTLLDELHVMKRRMTLVKYALFLSGIAFHPESGISLFRIFFIQRDRTSDHGAYHHVDDQQHDLFLRRDSSVYQSAQSAYSRGIAALTGAIWESALTEQMAHYNDF
jgi:hypothetical protein